MHISTNDSPLFSGLFNISLTPTRINTYMRISTGSNFRHIAYIPACKPPTNTASSKHPQTNQLLTYLHLDIEDGPELVDVGLASRAAEDALVGEGVELGNVPAEDLVSAGQPGVGRNDGVVGAGDGQGGAAVELVRGEPALVRSLGHAMVDVVCVRGMTMHTTGGLGMGTVLKRSGNASAALRRVDGEGELAVPGLDGLLSRHEGGHGVVSCCVVWKGGRRRVSVSTKLASKRTVRSGVLWKLEDGISGSLPSPVKTTRTIASLINCVACQLHKPPSSTKQKRRALTIGHCIGERQRIYLLRHCFSFRTGISRQRGNLLVA